jgi:hypothetical protein
MFVEVNKYSQDLIKEMVMRKCLYSSKKMFALFKTSFKWDKKKVLSCNKILLIEFFFNIYHLD